MANREPYRAPVTIAVRAILKQHRRAVVLTSTAVLALGATGIRAQQMPAAETPESAESSALGEVVVTAQRRNQTVQDIPYNISVVGQNEISESGATTADDLARVVTGLTTVDQGPAARSQINNLTLRGLRTDSPGGGSNEPLTPDLTANTVSTYFGETPIFFPMVLQDVERVEVLRGPQGTLYGSGAEGGTIRFIPRRPNFDAFDAEVSVTGSDTEHAERLNDDIHGMVNLPITDTLAARIVAGTQHLAGFINAPNLWELDSHGVPIPSIPGDISSGPKIGPEQKGVNSSNQTYARAALRWKPLTNVDLQLDYLHQTTTMADSQQVTPNWPGGCRDQTAVNQGAPVSCVGAPISTFYANAGGPYTTAAYGLQPYDDTVDLASFVATVDFGLAALTSASSYYDDRSLTVGDETGALLDIGGPNYNNFPPYNNFPRFQGLIPTPASTNSYVEELRLASTGKHFFDYVVGVFYQNQKADTQFHEELPGIQSWNTFIGLPTPSVFGEDVDILKRNATFDDEALFGELTAHITDKWQVTAGGRVFRQTFSDQFYGNYPLQTAAGVVPPGETTIYEGTIGRVFNNHLKKFNTSYDFGPNTKIYATYSEGFRHGGTNPLPTAGPYASLSPLLVFQPDFAKNYEFGIKGTVLDHRLRYSAAIYRIGITNFQFNSRSGSDNPATFNGSSARTEGVEAELQAAVTKDLSLSLGYTYTSAKTTSQLLIHDYPPFALIPADGGNGQPEVLFNIPSGARLPGVPLNTANFGADYAIPYGLLGNDAGKLTLHVDGVYRSAAAGDIDVTSLFYWPIPSSFTTDARAMFDVDKHFGFDLFVNNMTSDTAFSGAANVQQVPNPYALQIVARPRTIGLTLRYKY
jgi:iron complex outermembrane recepter protein